ncbi:MAG: FkbM family methyltransferase [Steroidobacter sp.]
MIHQYIKQVSKFGTFIPSVSLEIGALDGSYSYTLQQTFKLAANDIYLVEPNPDLCGKLVEKFPYSHLFRNAVSDEESTLTLNRVASGDLDKLGCSSLRDRIDGWEKQLSYSPVEVQCIRGEALLEKIQRPVDLCIIDVEGCTYEVLRSFGNSLPMIRSLMLECEHAEIFKGQRLFDDVATLLKHHNYRMMAFQYSYANQSDSIWIREEVLNVRYPG